MEYPSWWWSSYDEVPEYRWTYTVDGEPREFWGTVADMEDRLFNLSLDGYDVSEAQADTKEPLYAFA